MTIRTLGLICVRGGSKGLPGKNIRPFLGEPLVARAIRQAKMVPAIERVLVSTDSLEIAEVARAAGAWLPFMRPAELARDDAPEWMVWQHALRFVESETGALPESLVVTPATAPLRDPRDVTRCLERLERGGCDVVITVTASQRNPYFNMVRETVDGLVTLAATPEGPVTRRQAAPPLFDITPVAYAAHPAFVLGSTGIFQGRVASVQVAADSAIDIDTPLDFTIAELLASRGDVR